MKLSNLVSGFAEGSAGDYAHSLLTKAQAHLGDRNGVAKRPTLAKFVRAAEALPVSLLSQHQDALEWWGAVFETFGIGRDKRGAIYRKFLGELESRIDHRPDPPPKPPEGHGRSRRGHSREGRPERQHAHEGKWGERLAHAMDLANPTKRKAMGKGAVRKANNKRIAVMVINQLIEAGFKPKQPLTTVQAVHPQPQPEAPPVQAHPQQQARAQARAKAGQPTAKPKQTP